ncbi:MAG: aminotransferase class I/II-fold pyridoxal phosphate-dependent enzyme, partial [Anaerovoracaceae bacterium]
MQLSEKILSMQSSPIRKFNVFGQQAKEQGKTIHHLNIGQPDIETPECFLDAIKNFDSKVVAYAESGGMDILQNAIVQYFEKLGIHYDKTDMIITNGGSEALSMIFTSILNPRDEVLIAEPFYTNYYTFVTAADGVVVPITTSAEEGYHYATR